MNAGAERKRKVMQEWACPVCLETIDEGCVPAVMNGCTPFAHVACSKCLTEMKAQNKALCPKCRAPFSTIRALADFVDTDDADVAEELKKRQKSNDSLADRIEALAIDDPLLKQRVVVSANNFADTLQKSPRAELGIWCCWRTFVSEFDDPRAALTLTEARKKKIKVRDRYELQVHLDALTTTVLPALHLLFPKFRFESHTDYNSQKKRLGYLTIRSTPRAVFWS